jgi:hypothetical protein
MKWIRLKDKKPSLEIEGKKILIYRILNDNQESISISIFDTAMIKHCNKDETWWMALPDKPLH